MEYIQVQHTFPPVYDKHSRILILGSFPSVKSREQQFYYGHPQNRFWKMLAGIFREESPVTVTQKQELLLRHQLAVWDVIDSCEIQGSSDRSIRNVIPNDMKRILGQAEIRKILLNGGKAYELYCRYCAREQMPKAVKMPSTSPANAAWSLDRLMESWRKELEDDFSIDRKADFN